MAQLKTLLSNVGDGQFYIRGLDLVEPSSFKNVHNLSLFVENPSGATVDVGFAIEEGGSVFTPIDLVSQNTSFALAITILAPYLVITVSGSSNDVSVYSYV